LLKVILHFLLSGVINQGHEWRSFPYPNRSIQVAIEILNTLRKLIQKLISYGFVGVKGQNSLKELPLFRSSLTAGKSDEERFTVTV
jgi:hypothetical protein